MEAVEDFKQDEVANIPNSLLISASYISKTKKVSLKFYNPESEKIYPVSYTHLRAHET